MSKKNISYPRLLKRMRTHKNILMLLSLLLIIAGAVFLSHVNIRLDEYEKSQSYNVADAFIEETAHPDAQLFDKLSEMILIDAVDSYTAKDYFFNRINGKTLKYDVQVQTDPERVCYTLLASGENVGEIALKRLPVSSSMHYGGWTLESIRPLIKSDYLMIDLVDRIASGDYGLIVGAINPELYPNESSEELNACLWEIFSENEPELSEIPSDDTSGKTYLISAGSLNILSLRLAADENSAFHWRIADSDALFLKPVEYCAVVNKTDKVYVDGKLLGAAYIAEDDITSEHAAHLPTDIINPIDYTMCRYAFTYCFHAPEIKITDADGNELDYTFADDTATVSRAENAFDCTSLTDSIQRATEAIAKFTVGKSSIDAALKFIEYKSNAYLFLYEYSKWSSLKAGSVTMQSFGIRSATKLGDNCFTCDVESVAHCKYSESNIIDYPINYTFYYHQINGKWMIYDFIIK